MSETEFRTDPITGRVAIIVPGRSARPNDHAAPAPSATQDAGCPFCEGNEAKTPEEVAVDAPTGRAPNARGWYIRTIPNRFPTVTSDVSLAEVAVSSPPTEHRPAFGYHEVVIETPAHAPSLGYLPREQAVRVARMFRERVRHLSRLPHVGSVTLFENTGPESGGSLWHPHAQLVTVPDLTPTLREELEGAMRYRRDHGGDCAFERVLDAEVSDGRRTVLDADGFVAYAPFASSVPYEVRLMPKRHARSIAEATDEELTGFSDGLGSLLRALLHLLPGASYNYVIRTPLGSSPELERYHWHLDLLPRLVRPDGFDLGSGLSVNTVVPEVAADGLRAALGAKR